MATGTAPQVDDWQDTVSDWTDTSGPEQPHKKVGPEPSREWLLNQPRAKQPWETDQQHAERMAKTKAAAMAHLKDVGIMGAQAALATPLTGAASGESLMEMGVDKLASGAERLAPSLMRGGRALGAGALAAAEKVPVLGPIGKAFVGGVRGSLQGPPPIPGPPAPPVNFRSGPASPAPMDAPPVAFRPQPQRQAIAPPPVTMRPQQQAPVVAAPPVQMRPQMQARTVPPPPVRIPQPTPEPAMNPVPAPPVGRMRPGAEPEPLNTVTSPETAAPSTPVDRSGINNLVHGVGQKLGMDHDMLSAIARKRYGVKTMQDMSHDQMVDLYGTLLREGGPNPVGKPLPLKSTGKPSESTLEDQLMRSIEQSAKRAKKSAGPAEEPPEDITAYAKGGVIHKKHYLVDAKSGKVDGVMAEAGPERISPIAKGPSAERSLKSGADVIRGTSDIPLSKQGLQEADDLGASFAKKGFGRG